jgi:hypothetical protein
MSFDTAFEVSPNLLLALPTLLTNDPTSSSVRLGLPIERGSGTPRIFLRRVRLLRAKPPASPAAAAPTATAGPLALPAAVLSVSTMPLAFRLALRCLLLPPPRELDLFAPCRPRREPPALGRDSVREPEAPLRRREDGDDFERAAPPDDREESLRDVEPPERDGALASALELEPVDELPLLCLLPDAALLAITHPFSDDAIR